MAFNNQEAGRFTIDIKLTSANFIERKALNMSYVIPKQILRLRGMRVRMETDGDARDAGVLYVDIQKDNGQTLLSYNHLIDNNPNTVLYSLPLQNAIVTESHGLDKVLYLSDNTSLNLYVSVYVKDSSGVFTLTDKIVELYMDFETVSGSLF